MNIKTMKTLTLTPKQVKAVSLLVSGMSGRAVAKEVGVSPQTVSEWNNDPVIEVYVNQLKQDALDEARDRIRGLALEATKNLEDLMRNAKSEEVKRKVCMSILDIVGISDPTTGVYGWGIGSTTLPQEKSDDEYHSQMNELMEKLKL